MEATLFSTDRSFESNSGPGQTCPLPGPGRLSSPPAAGPLQLRWYQLEAVEAIWKHLHQRDDNPCAVLPTAAGKTAVIATLCQQAVMQWGGRVLVATHVRELIEQSARTLASMSPGLKVGVYSAGLKRRDMRQPVIVAGIQSVYERALDFDPFDLVIVDECVPAGTLVATPLGDVPIEALRPGQSVLNAIGTGVIVATSARPAMDLLTLEFDDGSRLTCTERHPVFTASGWIEAGAVEVGAMAFGITEVRALRDGVQAVEQVASDRRSASDEGTRLAQAAILLDLLLKEARERDDESSDARKSVADNAASGASAAIERRERATNASGAAGDALAARHAVGCGARDTDAHATNQGVADVLQDRPGESHEDDRDRTRWPQSRDSVAERAGSPEDSLPRGKRVVRSTRHERTRIEVVHNLHVSGHPSYFADGTLVHNCHLIPDSGEGMYRRFLADLRVARPTMRVIGLTATPYRMHTPVCAPENFLNHVCYEVGVRELIVQGYLSPLRSKAGHAKADLSQVAVRGGEFVAGELEQAMDRDSLVASAVQELLAETANRRSVLIFASGVDHAQHIAEAIAQHGHESVVVTGKTPIPQRDAATDRFRAGSLKYLVNYGVFTTGFDAPNVDAIVLLRATMSPGLYYQMVGRGFRIAPGKADCLVLDYGDNVLRHGPVDQLSTKIKEIQRRKGTGDAPAKQCEKCDALVAAGYSICPECGTPFPERQRTPHGAEASTAGILSYQVETCEREVKDIEYSEHFKRDAEGKPPTLRVRYYFDYYMESASEWVCIEHAPGSFARRKAEEWWARHSERPFPSSVAEAVQLCQDGEVRRPTHVELRRKAGEKWWEVTRAIFPEIPGAESTSASDDLASLASEVPF